MCPSQALLANASTTASSDVPKLSSNETTVPLGSSHTSPNLIRPQLTWRRSCQNRRQRRHRQENLYGRLPICSSPRRSPQRLQPASTPPDPPSHTIPARAPRSIKRARHSYCRTHLDRPTRQKKGTPHRSARSASVFLAHIAHSVLFHVQTTASHPTHPQPPSPSPCPPSFPQIHPPEPAASTRR